MNNCFFARHGRISINGYSQYHHFKILTCVEIPQFAPYHHRSFSRSSRTYKSSKIQDQPRRKDQIAILDLLRLSEGLDTSASAASGQSARRSSNIVNHSFKSRRASHDLEDRVLVQRPAQGIGVRRKFPLDGTTSGQKTNPRESAESAWQRHHKGRGTPWTSESSARERTVALPVHAQQGVEKSYFTMGEKRQAQEPASQPKKKMRLTKRNKGGGKGSIDGIPWPDGSNDEILRMEVQELLDQAKSENKTDGLTQSELPALGSEIELKIKMISSTGDGLALSADGKHVYVVPFAVTGDVVLARPYLLVAADSFTRADFLEVVSPGSLRDDSRVGCQYFSKCGGCQFQMMLPEDQHTHKKQIVEDAFARFSGIDPSVLPEIESTLPSPLQYNYRTKLTPHFDGPPGFTRRNKDGRKPRFEEVPPIGFMLKGRRKVIDIEDCPIGSEAVRYGLRKEKQRVADTISSFSKGATILLRETTVRRLKTEGVSIESFKDPIIRETDQYFETKNYVSDNNASVKEYVGDSLLISNANSFFQNNNSILSPFLDYVKQRIFASSTDAPKPKYLVDAYCGSGLFTVTLASLFEKSIGVDIDQFSIEFAKQNAIQNGLKDRASFITATASEIFQDIKFPASETVMIIDPPRKGCDLPFLRQLMKFGPNRIVYVSCNVHTQARDIGFMVNGVPNIDGGFGEGKGAYTIESIRGCDFFPQTAHVEGVAVLQRKAVNEATIKSKSSDPSVDLIETSSASVI